ncbi:CLUMA_CG015162, isoform A [Clunio marinus]|uniref:Cytochrome b5-related protein n=1 Tax=Clunio marinus TaxID=568069 RepID=A0A1J1IR89_9DIPT|nr:CLUMA_CG015162, isoform A [Clunio marinus]
MLLATKLETIMLRKILLFICFITFSLRINSQYCEKKENCDIDKSNYDEATNLITLNIKDAVKSYIPCKSENCSCHVNVLKRDFEPFKTGITKDMIKSLRSHGIIYQIINNKIYRQKDCNFPSRCSGVEHFIKKVLKKVKLPNMDLIINVRDYPQVYPHHGPIGPVLSFSKTKDYQDIMYPAWSFYEGGPAIKLYPTGLGRFDLLRESLKSEAEKIPWNKKKSKAFFRGSRTSDERDALVLLSRSNPELVDAQYTKNQAWKSPADTLNAEPAEEVSLEDHCKYKFLFNYRGVAASFRFKHLFLCKSLVFHVGDEWQEFFYDSLKPWVHYIPVNSKSKPEDLKILINYFKHHQDEAQEIAERGFEMIWKNLKLEDVECYWRRLLRQYGRLFKDNIKFCDIKIRPFMKCSFNLFKMKAAGKHSIASYYPEFRDKQVKTVYDWLECRRAVENAEGLWRIHDKLYDLTDFMDRHPGGKEWLEITKGNDITELFELHHIQLTAEKMLPKFYVRDAAQPRSYKLTFKEDGFFRTLKRRVRDFKLDHGPEKRSKIYSDLIMFGIFAASICSVWMKSTFLMVFTGLLFAWGFFIGHNFLHQRNNWRKIMINFSLMSFREIRISHIFSHHIYTNSFNDLEVTLPEPAVSWFPVKEKSWMQRYGSWIYSWLVFGIFPQVLLIQRLVLHFTTPVKSFFMEDLIPFSVPLAMYIFGRNELFEVLKCWNLILIFGGLWFGIIGVTVGHHSPQIVHEGDEIHKSMDFGIYQLDTVVDRKDVKVSQFLVLTHLGEHTLHHFFPTLDHGILPQLNDVFMKTCKEFDTELREFSWYKLLIGHHNQLARNETFSYEERKKLL